MTELYFHCSDDEHVLIDENGAAWTWPRPMSTRSAWCARSS
jgi:hypothetical protein